MASPSMSEEQEIAGGEQDRSPRAQYRTTYLNSDGWRALRSTVLERDNFECRGCGRRSRHNDVHHLFYRSNWTRAEPDDLVTLCRDCHNIVEALTRPFEVSGKREGLRRFNLAVSRIARFKERRAEMLRG